MTDTIDVGERAFCKRALPEVKHAFVPKPTLTRPKLFITLDTEAATNDTRNMPGFNTPRWSWITQNLLFASSRISSIVGSGLITTDEILFYPDDLPEYGQQILAGYVQANTIPMPDSEYDRRSLKGAREGLYLVQNFEQEKAEEDGAPLSRVVWRDEPNTRVWLLPLSRFLVEFFRIAHEQRGLVLGFNLPFDFGRLAWRWGAAKKRADIGAFSMVFWNYLHSKGGKTTLEENTYRPRVIVNKAGPRKNFIRFGKIYGKKNEGRNLISDYRGQFLDLGTLAFALSNRTFSLAGACKEFCGLNLNKNVEHGIITPDYIHYGRSDVKATTQLCSKLLSIFDRHPISRASGGDLSECNAFSPVSLGKAYFKKVGFAAPKIPDNRIGPSFAAFHGGWTEVRFVGHVPVALLDFTKMYQTIFVLMRLQEFISCKRLELIEATKETIEFVDKITLKDLFDPCLWPKLQTLCWVSPKDDIVMTRGKFDETQWTTGMVPRTSHKAHPYVLADVVLAKLLSPVGKIPRIVRAERVVPVDPNQLSLCNLPCGRVFDPAGDPFFKFNVEESARLKLEGARRKAGGEPYPFSADYQDIPDDAFPSLVDGTKCIGNGTPFGAQVETNAQALPEGVAEEVTLIGSSTQKTNLLHPEDPGRLFCPIVGSLITAGARLLLGMAHALVTAKDGVVAFGDTDSLAPIATIEGGEVSVDIQSSESRHGKTNIKGLSDADISEIIQTFESLNPYDRSLIPGSILEKKTFKEMQTEQKYNGQIHALCLSSKRYMLTDPTGMIVLDRKESALGALLSPLVHAPGDDRTDISKDWIAEAWKIVADFFDRGRTIPQDWLSRPVVHRLALAKPRTIKALANFNKGPIAHRMRPFNFFIVSTNRVDRGKHQAVIAPYERDPARWREIDWYSTRTAEKITTPKLNTIHDYLLRYAQQRSPEWLDRSGNPVKTGGRTAGSRGLMERRPIHDGAQYLLTKESLTLGEDPDNAFERRREEQVQVKAGTQDKVDDWDALRKELKSIGPKRLSGICRVSESVAKRWLGGASKPANVQKVRNQTKFERDKQGPLLKVAAVLATIQFVDIIGGSRPAAALLKQPSKQVDRWIGNDRGPPKSAISTYQWIETLAKSAKRLIKPWFRRQHFDEMEDDTEYYLQALAAYFDQQKLEPIFIPQEMIVGLWVVAALLWYESEKQRLTYDAMFNEIMSRVGKGGLIMDDNWEAEMTDSLKEVEEEEEVSYGDIN